METHLHTTDSIYYQKNIGTPEYEDMLYAYVEKRVVCRESLERMSSQILIYNLPKTIDAYELACLFKSQGRIASCCIDMDERLISKGRGSITFLKSSSARGAVRDMHGHKFLGHKLRVRPAAAEGVVEEEVKSVQKSFTKIFVKDIPLSWGEEELRQEFADFGEIRTVNLSREEGGKSNGYGFVDFKRHSSAESAVADRPSDLRVEPYLPKPLRNPPPSKKKQRKNLYVKGIHKDLGDPELRELFELFGPVKSCKVERDAASGASRGFGYVCFCEEADAEKARDRMNGSILNSKQLFVSFHQSRDEREQILQRRSRSVT